MDKNFETLKTPDEKSEVIRTTQQKLLDLNLSIGPDKRKDKEKFEKLSKDSILKNGLNKLYNKNCKLTFSEEWKHFEKLHIGGTIQKIVKKYPNLLLYITGNLGLPLEEKSFSKLSLQQKLNFTALYQAVTANGLFYKKNATPQDILERVKGNTKLNMDKINKNFELNNIKNFLDLEQTLKSFGLNSTEIGKIKEYLLIIKKHSEFVGINKPLESGSGWGYAIVAILALALGWLGKTYVDNLGKIEPEETTIIEGVTTINEPEAVLKLITSEVDWSVNGRKELKPKAEGIFYSMLNSNIITRKILLDPYMDAQTKEILMNLEGRSVMQFDLKKGSRIDIDAKDGKGEIYVQLPYPDIVTVKTEAHVTKVDRELVHVKEYDKGQEDLRQELEKKAIEDLKNSQVFYENGKNDVSKQLFDLFSTMYAPVGLKVTGVHVKFINPDEGPKNFIDPERKHIINFE